MQVARTLPANTGVLTGGGRQRAWAAMFMRSMHDCGTVAAHSLVPEMSLPLTEMEKLERLNRGRKLRSDKSRHFGNDVGQQTCSC